MNNTKKSEASHTDSGGGGDSEGWFDWLFNSDDSDGDGDGGGD